MNNQNNLNNLFSSGLFPNTPSKDNNSMNMPSYHGMSTVFNQSNVSLKNGSRDKQYEPQKLKDERGFSTLKYNHINVMKEYSDKSCDELRWEDYNIGRRPNVNIYNNTSTPVATFSTSNFQQSNLFAQNVEPPAFKVDTTNPTSIFNTPQTNPLSNTQTSNVFNQPLTQNTSSLFTPLAVKQPSSVFQTQVNDISTQPNNIFSSQSNNAFPTQPNNIFSMQANNTSSTPNNMFMTQPNTSQPVMSSLSNQSSIRHPQETPYYQQPFTNLTDQSSQFYNQQPVCNQSTFINTNSVCTNPQSSFLFNASVQNDKSDPYGTKNIKFHFVEKDLSPFQRLLAEPLPQEPLKMPVDQKLVYRSPELEKLVDVYFSPSLNEIRGLTRINNMTLTFPGKGKIEFLEPIKVADLTIENISKKILFNSRHVYVTDKPGLGLNVSARITIEKLFPICKTDDSLIIGKADKYPQKGIQDRFIYELKNDTIKRFEDYDCTRGLYVYTVKHF